MPNTKRPLNVFLCHAREDKGDVHKISVRLTNDGVYTWVDENKILPGHNWELEIRKAVREADVIVICLSKSFNQEGYRQKEMKQALDTAEEKPEGEIFIIPARLADCEIPDRLRKLQCVDMFQDGGYAKLMLALQTRAEAIGATIQKGNISSSKVENSTQNDQAILSSLQSLLEDRYNSVVIEKNMQLVGEALRDILSEHGIGIALLVAHSHGLSSGHIPQMRDNLGKILKQVEIIHDKGDRYTFVHVPVRMIRTDKNELIRRGIMNKKADPTGFIYHEDGLISNFSFDLNSMNKECKTSFSTEDISTMLEHLALHGVLVPANVENRQIQFKDDSAKGMIKKSEDAIYVKYDHRPIRKENLVLPERYNSSEVRAFVANAIRVKSACNYCSISALNPLEATIHSTPLRAKEPHGTERSTVRNYQFGFTFSPFGDPATMCHFLAWDFPHINEQVNNMDPQGYSFSDLIKLVTVINADIDKFCRANKIEIVPKVSGVCNHWAGNSIYHQHYQFFILKEIPALSNKPTGRIITSIDNVTIQSLDWPIPWYEISSSSEDDDKNIMFVADRVAKNWEELNDGFDESYGNGIRIKNHTQNIFVTQDGKRTRAIFVPRFRNKLHAKAQISEHVIEKRSMGAMETLGYFLIDNIADFDMLRNLTPENRNHVGKDLLSNIAPPRDRVVEFEKRVSERLTPRVIHYELKFDEADERPIRERKYLLCHYLMEIIGDKNLSDQQCRILATEANRLLKEKSPQDAYTPDALDKLIVDRHQSN